MSNNLSTITNDFVDREAAGFMARIVNEGNTIELCTLQTGVAYKATINSVWADGNFQYGTCAGTDATATTSSLEPRELLACKTSLYDGICMEDVAAKFGNLAGDGTNEAALSAIAEGALSQLQSQVEVDLWNQADAALCGQDGLYFIISGSTTGVASVSSPTSPASAAITAVNEVYETIPAIASNRGDLGIFLSVANFKKYLVALSTSTGAVLGGYDVKRTANNSLMYVEHPTVPGCLVIGTMGLTANRVVGGPLKDLVVGTDTSAESLGFQLWYDINSDQVKYRVNAKFGANIANPGFWASNDLT